MLSPVYAINLTLFWQTTLNSFKKEKWAVFVSQTHCTLKPRVKEPYSNNREQRRKTSKYKVPFEFHADDELKTMTVSEAKENIFIQS